MSLLRSPVRSVVSLPPRSVLGGASESVPAGPSLSLSISPASVAEDAGTTTGTVTRSGDTTGILAVTLSSNDTTEATVPASVNIPDGQSSADFTITILNENTADGDQVATISASATDFTGASATVTVTDVGVSSFAGINSLALTDVNVYSGELGTSGSLAPFTDTGSLGDSWTSGNSPGIVASGSGYYADWDENHGVDSNWVETAGNPWSGQPDCDIFFVLRKSPSKDNIGRFMFRPTLYWDSGNSAVMPPVNAGGSMTVDGVSVTTAGELFTAVDDGDYHIIRVAGADLTGFTTPDIGTSVASLQPEDMRLLRMCVIPSSDVTSNLSDINAELQAHIDNI